MFWKRNADVNPDALDRAKMETAESKNRAEALSSEAHETASVNRELRQSNGFVEAIYKMWFPPEDSR
jgi:hypothetical protein